MTAVNRRQTAELEILDHQIGLREKEVTNLVGAVRMGRFSLSLSQALEIAEADLAELRARRSAATPQRISLPEDLPLVYRAHVQDTVASLSHEKALGRASEMLRSLIEKVTVTYDPDQKCHQLTINGDLRVLLELGGAHDKPDGDPAGRGGGSPARRPFPSSANDKAPTNGGGSRSSTQMQTAQGLFWAVCIVSRFGWLRGQDLK
ncbi:hypothetical protein [Rubellimicrobium aerolatum]|uniref:Uncharacterized protein n=1 Tax=Rubellimicrobium aerolatum TaxID=490979 RepID=A0ABW0SII6_9RHOB|nr:hypothetical protein [Rubellimicrobium aerolatum]MBP1807810.1 hypothetical protein [Rubellimicrobium aerolatum]